jgi:hypothetical protein
MIVIINGENEIEDIGLTINYLRHLGEKFRESTVWKISC